MRQFRFRLDPVIRLKEYQIERKEEEISEIDAQMERLIGDIEAGRQAVQDMRHRVLEETPDEQLIHAERTLDQFRSYMVQVEAQKRKEIESLEEKKEAKRQELVTLYQEEKILDRYKEKKRQDWQKDVQREENLLMDELGTQNFVRRKNEHGGVMLYLLLPILLAGAAAGLGWYFNVIDKDTLRKIPYVKSLIPASATATLAEQQVASTPTEPTEALTWEQMLGDPDQPMPELLSNIAKERENLNKIAEQLAEREKSLRARER
ncbi:hypothetical protein GF373_13230, partial [bacterium]|nr:hypothetical protein [bacterium]